MTEQQLKDKCLWIAIGHHLSEHDDGLETPQSVVDAIENELTELYMPWQPFEHEEPSDLADYIISMATDIYDLAKAYKESTQ